MSPTVRVTVFRFVKHDKCISARIELVGRSGTSSNFTARGTECVQKILVERETERVQFFYKKEIGMAAPLKMFYVLFKFSRIFGFKNVNSSS